MQIGINRKNNKTYCGKEDNSMKVNLKILGLAVTGLGLAVQFVDGLIKEKQTEEIITEKIEERFKEEQEEA